MKWVEIEHGNKKLPDWLRSAAINDDGTVFAPAALAADEQAAFSSASWDGVPAVVNYVHVFLPTTCLAPECPQIEMLCKKSSTRFETLSQHLVSTNQSCGPGSKVREGRRPSCSTVCTYSAKTHNGVVSSRPIAEAAKKWPNRVPVGTVMLGY